MKMYFSFLPLFLAFCVVLYAEEKLIPIGNFALSTTLQPGPIFSIGQNIIEKGDLLVYETFTYLQGKNHLLEGLSSTALYGISNSLSLFITVPVALKLRDRSAVSSGVGDVLVQGEYAFYQKNGADWAAQATAVGALWFATGSTRKVPATGSGTEGFFFGTTYNYMTPEWYSFTSYGVSFSSSMRRSLVSPQFFYEAGVGMNLGDSAHRILLALFEINGIYTTDSNNEASVRSIGRRFVPHAVGNLILAGPSLFYSNKRWVIQAGIQFPITQSSRSGKTIVRAELYVGLKF